MLSGVYCEPSACDDQFVNDIISSASFDGGPEAFTSIAFAKKNYRTFDELMIMNKNIPYTLIMGVKDPWIVPYWGQRAKRVREEVLYLELDESGHCPHHETPQTFNYVFTKLLNYIESDQYTSGSGII